MRRRPGGRPAVLGSGHDQPTEPDPRGPCGAKIAALPTPGARVLFNAQPGGVGVEHRLYAMGEGRAARHLAELRADMRPDCPAFQSRSAFGFHTSQFLGEMMTPPVGDDRLAIRTRTQFADTRTAWVTSAAIRSGDDLSVVLLATWEPTSPDLAVELVMAAGRKVP